MHSHSLLPPGEDGRCRQLHRQVAAVLVLPRLLLRLLALQGQARSARVVAAAHRASSMPMALSMHLNLALCHRLCLAPSGLWTV